MDIEKYNFLEENEYSLLLADVPSIGRSWFGLLRNVAHERLYFIVRGKPILEGMHILFKGPYAERPFSSENGFVVKPDDLKIVESSLEGASLNTRDNLVARLQNVESFRKQYYAGVTALEELIKIQK